MIEHNARKKHWVGVVSLSFEDGRVRPLRIAWDDGRVWDVDKVLGCKQAHAATVGGCGMRYNIEIGGHRTSLWYDDYRRRWFVEAKEAPNDS